MPRFFLFAFLIPFLAVSGGARDLSGLGVDPVVIEVDGQEGFMLKPNARWPGANATPWVLYAPSLPPYPGKAEHWMLERLLAHQYIIKRGIGASAFWVSV